MSIDIVLTFLGEWQPIIPQQGRRELDADRDDVVVKLASPILYTICLSITFTYYSFAYMDTMTSKRETKLTGTVCLRFSEVMYAK